MSYFGNGKQGEKIFRGAYTYARNSNVYSEETFEVFRDKKEMTYIFETEMISRVSTGELLTININYKINKDYIPLEVDIKRSLGAMNVMESYIFNQRTTRIDYKFFDGENKTEIEFPTTPKFYITTPATCCSMLYLRSKKFDPTSKNYYSIYTSKNMWEYKEEPSVKNIMVQRVSATSENLKVDGNNLQSIQYKLQEQTAENSDDKKPPELAKGQLKPTPSDEVRVWTSQHMTIPYLIKANDGTKIQVKYLNNLSQDQ
ncbi:hypothetical protein [Bacteriovorax sp. Seq25_V]|uniref:hypothetical protein n=1 Tax=Bacteriovorax sp. Seq25_V TaxID=1201288 RepID=UPI00038A417E|nr:hypothetical protein [Bacteriovorax sp. Seq25_V]EQC46049.1 hypothetical protein M900_1810 [Bacteriovorax sp. Seq25_V]